MTTPRYSTTAKVYEAIVQVQEALAKDGISKNRKNQAQGYAFRGIDDIYNALANHLASARLCILPRLISREVTERRSEKDKALFYVVVDVDFDFVSALDGSKHTVRMAGEAMDSGDKATNKAMSAAYKYACLQTFCIPTEADNDADAHTHTVKPNQSKTTSQAKSDPKLEAARAVLFQKVNPETGEETEDDLPNGFGMTPKDMSELVNHCRFSEIGKYELRIVTPTGTKTVTVKEAVEKHSDFVMKNFEKFNEVAQMALDAYAVFVSEANHAN